MKAILSYLFHANSTDLSHVSLA